MTDFYIVPYQQMDEINEEPVKPTPLMYYDNDDGFWDEEIKRKMEKWGRNIQSEMLIHRTFLKH